MTDRKAGVVDVGRFRLFFYPQRLFVEGVCTEPAAARALEIGGLAVEAANKDEMPR
ncbi:hypothetical protein [Methylovirgula sp. 4M-Z18]|uniref:hypothetical protein n=1 Tax=Methylovirgula sp. 4M-Z18 TaxID=2293567 RepID=UPI001FE004FE|nr:hypothetical protein [Methylovirgula sp. 4M-Z18]